MGETNTDPSLLRVVTVTALVVLLLVVPLAVLLPNYELARLRVEYPLFNRPMAWAEGFRSFDMVHFLLFGALGFVARVVLRSWPLRRLTLGLVALAAVTELVQFVVPGRQPRWSDFSIDIAVGVLGLALAAAILSDWWRSRTLCR